MVFIGAQALDGHMAVDYWEYISSSGEMVGGIMIGGTSKTSCEGEPGFRYPGEWSRISGLVSIDGGFEHQCTLGTDGTLDCWGCMDGVVIEPPAGRFTDYASGDEHACAIDKAGTAVCWGASNAGQTTPPLGAAFSSIAAGGDFSCGIQVDGEVLCWGSSSAAQTLVP
jgi:alpha-tubulin suppressor-like RCC1 family protein